MEKTDSVLCILTLQHGADESDTIVFNGFDVQLGVVVKTLQVEFGDGFQSWDFCIIFIYY